MTIKALIFDLDGVIVSTDEYHYQAWKMLADTLSIPFDRELNEQLRGVSRMESLDIILNNARAKYSDQEKNDLAETKNKLYVELLSELTTKAILPGVIANLDKLKSHSVKLAIGSSSKNARIILNKTGLTDFFDCIVDGTMIDKSKPDPEVFLLAAEKLRLEPLYCMVIEDAIAGVSAAKNAGMKVVGIGSASNCDDVDKSVNDLSEIDLVDFINP